MGSEKQNSGCTAYKGKCDYTVLSGSRASFQAGLGGWAKMRKDRRPFVCISLIKQLIVYPLWQAPCLRQALHCEECLYMQQNKMTNHEVIESTLQFQNLKDCLFVHVPLCTYCEIFVLASRETEKDKFNNYCHLLSGLCLIVKPYMGYLESI